MSEYSVQRVNSRVENDTVCNKQIYKLDFERKYGLPIRTIMNNERIFSKKNSVLFW